MAKKHFEVNVPEQEMKVVEKYWYEYTSSCDIIAHIMQQKGVIWDTLQEYINVSELRFTTCEMAKNQLATKYKPKEIDLNNYNYMFDFVENNIVFDEA